MGCYSRVYFSTGYEYGSSMNRNDARPPKEKRTMIIFLNRRYSRNSLPSCYSFFPRIESSPPFGEERISKENQFFFSKENFTPSKVDLKLECFRLFPFLLLPNRLFYREKDRNSNNNFRANFPWQSSIPNAAANNSNSNFLFSLIFRNHTCTLPDSITSPRFVDCCRRTG